MPKEKGALLEEKFLLIGLQTAKNVDQPRFFVAGLFFGVKIQQIIAAYAKVSRNGFEGFVIRFAYVANVIAQGGHR